MQAGGRGQQAGSPQASAQGDRSCSSASGRREGGLAMRAAGVDSTGSARGRGALLWVG